MIVSQVGAHLTLVPVLVWRPVLLLWRPSYSGARHTLAPNYNLTVLSHLGVRPYLASVSTWRPSEIGVQCYIKD
uniref:Secreted protein n=1 Tax=Romanomermis culicivorax TaxID=13658 RepID=A0A915IWN6_ROMCU